MWEFFSHLADPLNPCPHFGRLNFAAQTKYGCRNGLSPPLLYNTYFFSYLSLRTASLTLTTPWSIMRSPMLTVFSSLPKLNRQLLLVSNIIIIFIMIMIMIMMIMMIMTRLWQSTYRTRSVVMATVSRHLASHNWSVLL